MSDDSARRNPFVGLRPYFKADSLYFFGRDAQIEELLAILRNNRFLGVVGSSGSGKSSLVRAGLVPALLGGFLVHDRDRWRRVTIKPGDAPMANLAAGLVAAMSKDPDAEAQSGSPEAQSLEAALRAGHTPAALDYIRTRLEPNANLFVLVDQFEELFAFRGADDSDDQPDADPERRKERARRKAEASDFVDLMLALADQRELPVYVALTMRTDFLGDCDLFFGLPEALNRGRYLVPRMTREQLRDTVECPALLAGAEVAPRLTDHVLNALGDRFDRLPVLSHALMRTWDAWLNDGATGPVDLRHFESAGGLENALNLDAEAALVGLDPVAVERIFKRLTDTDSSGRRIRSPARISALVAAAGVDRPVVEAILQRYEADGRSFVHPSPDGRPEDPRVDISHESLIRQWTRLRDWVDAERRSRDSYVALVDRAEKFARKEVDRLQGPELRLARNWQKAAKPTAGWAARYARGADDFGAAMLYLRSSIRRVRIGRVLAAIVTVGTIFALAVSLSSAIYTINTSTEQTSAMVARVYRMLDPIDGTEAAQRELIERTLDMNNDLAGEYEESNLFWWSISQADTAYQKAWAAYIAAPPDDVDAEATFNKALELVAAEYRAATVRALDQVRADPGNLTWYEHLSTALGKYAEAADADTTDRVYLAAIAVNKSLVIRNPKSRDYLTVLATTYGDRGFWWDNDDPADQQVARAMYVLAEATAGRLLGITPITVEAMTTYIDAATPLLEKLDAAKDAESIKRIQATLLTQSQRRAQSNPDNEEWQLQLKELQASLGIKPTAPQRALPRKGAKSS